MIEEIANIVMSPGEDRWKGHMDEARHDNIEI